MSNPASKVEIDDVLSSIRRLVSESDAEPGKDVPSIGDKLLLTPAFRVHDNKEKDRLGSVGTAPNAEISEKTDQDCQDDEASMELVDRVVPADDSKVSDAEPVAKAHDASTNEGVQYPNEIEETPPIFKISGEADKLELAARVDTQADISAKDSSSSLDERVAELKKVLGDHNDTSELHSDASNDLVDVLTFHADRLRDGASDEAELAQLEAAAFPDRAKDSDNFDNNNEKQPKAVLSHNSSDSGAIDENSIDAADKSNDLIYRELESLEHPSLIFERQKRIKIEMFFDVLCQMIQSALYLWLERGVAHMRAKRFQKRAAKRITCKQPVQIAAANFSIHIRRPLPARSDGQPGALSIRPLGLSEVNFITLQFGARHDVCRFGQGERFVRF